MNKIKLGTYVEDPVTGFKGIAENRATYLYGCDRICVQPRMKEDGTIPDSRMFDEPQLLTIVCADIPEIPSIPPAPERVKMGNLVKDPLNGVEGTLTGRSVYLNGCARVYIEPTVKYRKDFSPYWVDEQQVVDTGKSLLTKHNPKPEESRSTGGPARASSKY